MKSAKPLIGRLRWRSRRGMLELELLLLPFAGECLQTMTPDELASYEALLGCDDWDIYDWLAGRATPAHDHAGMIALIREFHAQQT